MKGEYNTNKLEIKENSKMKFSTLRRVKLLSNDYLNDEPTLMETSNSP